MANEPYLGAIFIFAGNFAPRGFQLCNGQLLAISQNTALFSILGTTYGGDGVQTFALPDLRGRTPIGQGAGLGLNPVVLGESSGNQNVTILSSNMPAHNHLVNVSNTQGSLPLPQGNYIAGVVDSNLGNGTSFNNAGTAGSTLAPASVSMAGNNLPLSIQNPYLGINYIIAVQGIFPSRN